MVRSKDGTIHVGKNGRPMKCIAKKVACPLSPLAHFANPEEAQSFADEYNELVAEKYDYKDVDSNTAKDLSDARLVYISDDIKANSLKPKEYKEKVAILNAHKKARDNAKLLMGLGERNLARQLDYLVDKREESNKARDEYYKIKADFEKGTEGITREDVKNHLKNYQNKRAELKVAWNTANEEVPKMKAQLDSVKEKKYDYDALVSKETMEVAQDDLLQGIKHDVDNEIRDRTVNKSLEKSKTYLSPEAHKLETESFRGSNITNIRNLDRLSKTSRQEMYDSVLKFKKDNNIEDDDIEVSSISRKEKDKVFEANFTYFDKNENKFKGGTLRKDSRLDGKWKITGENWMDQE